jgi:nitrate/TMAO reductase-like tetraheme cytochrome c subunit
MRRISLIVLVVAVAALVVPAMALAGGWNTPSANPHGSYATNSNLCKSCHAVHEAELSPETNGEKLLRSTVAGACDYCHVGGAISATQVYNSLPASYAADVGNEHTLGTGTDIPDSGDAAGSALTSNDYNIDFSCVSCHSVHGANTLAGGNILKNNPYTPTAGTVTTLDEFCADCHDNNYVTVLDTGGASDQSSHVMTTTLGSIADNPSDNCRDCHSGGNGTQANNWPHLTTGYDFLKDAYAQFGTDAYDSVCLDCHSNVGSTY